ncbi:Glycosyltransferase Family 49 protein [Gigaspora rosea]|uniref:Glycosyltransferase Family 49 protein n=1 Tax=Gigaspora rosea TaxID=44941 RepID=A0A397V9Q3_9GLOM|nr:Glycosyltransferase Family 49 protein [Gigaspora rosea]
MWFNKYSYLSGASSPSRCTPKAYVTWLLKSKLVKTVMILYIIFSMFFTPIRLVAYLFATEVLEPPEPSVNFMLNAIPRTYETNSISPLSEMKPSIRFSKMHTYLPHSLTDNIYPYYFRADFEPDNNDVTVAAYITPNRLDDLVRLADIWQGPISATLHLPLRPKKHDDEYIKDILDTIKHLYEKNQNISMYVDIHLIMGPYSTTNTTLQPVQTNIHMNTARFFARTEFIFFLDSDTWPIPGLRSRILKHNDLLLNNDALILPTFIFANNDAKNNYEFPKKKLHVKKLVQSRLLGLKNKGWELNNGPTCLKKWMKSNELYKVENYESHYTPNFVIRKTGRIPWCSERFENNKAACLFQIYLSGSELWVAPKEFLMIHQYNSDSHLSRYEESKWQRAFNSRMYSTFVRETCLQYARRFSAIGKWKSPIADHVKQECERILGGWGVSFNDGYI